MPSGSILVSFGAARPITEPAKRRPPGAGSCLGSRAFDLACRMHGGSACGLQAGSEADERSTELGADAAETGNEHSCFLREPCGVEHAFLLGRGDRILLPFLPLQHVRGGEAVALD